MGNKDKNVEEAVQASLRLRGHLQGLYKEVLSKWQPVKYVEVVGTALAEVIDHLQAADLATKKAVDAGNEFLRERGVIANGCTLRRGKTVMIAGDWFKQGEEK